MFKFFSSSVTAGIGAALILGISADSHAAITTGFESGYSAGPLNGQNGWVNASNAGLTINATAGNPNFAAVNPNTANNGSLIMHGVTFVPGQTYRFQVDAKLPDSASAFLGLGWSGIYIAMGAWNSQGASDGFRLETSAGLSQDLALGIDNQWYHMTMDWTVGGIAEMTVLDSGNAQVFHTTVNVAALNHNDPSLGELVLYSNGVGVASGAAFDNISFGIVPEPASCLGIVGYAITTVLRRRRV